MLRLPHRQSDPTRGQDAPDPYVLDTSYRVRPDCAPYPAGATSGQQRV